MAFKILHLHQQRRTDSCWAWLVCFASFAVHFLVIGQLNSFGSLFVALLEEFRRSEAETAWIGSLAVGMTFILGPVSTSLCARWGCRVVTCAGSLLLLAGMALTSVVEEMSLMYLTYGVLVGTAGSFLYFSSFTAVSLYFCKHLSLASGIVFAGGGCGTLALSLLTSKLSSQFGFKMTVRLLACSSLPLFLAGLTFSPVDDGSRSVEEEKTKKEDKFAKETTLVQKLVHLLRPSEVFQNKAFLVWTVAMTLVLFCYYIPYMYLARLAEDIGIPSSQGAMLVGYCAMAQTAGKLIFGKLADFRSINRLLVTQTAILVVAVATALLPLAQSYSALVTFSVVAGFFDGGFVTMVGLVIHEIVGHQMMAKAVGTMYGVVALPMTIGPPVAGCFYDSLGNYHAVFLLCSGLLTAGICLMFLVPWLMPVKTDAKEPLLLSEIPLKTTQKDDELKRPERLAAQHDATPGYEEFITNFSIEHRLLPSEPTHVSRPSSFILFSIIPPASLRDLSERVEPHGKSRNASSLSLYKTSSQKLNECIKCGVKPLNELRQSNVVGGINHSKLVAGGSSSCFCDILPELGMVQDFRNPNTREISVDIEAAERFVSSDAGDYCDGTSFTDGHQEGGECRIDWIGEGLEETRDRSISWNSSGSNVSLKSGSQASDGTNDSGYIEGLMSPFAGDNFQDNSESSEEFSSKSDDICFHCNPLASFVDKQTFIRCESCKCGVEEQAMDSTNTNYGSSGDFKQANNSIELDCLKNNLADVRNTARHDYYSDLMESTLEESTCTCAEDDSADCLDVSCKLCKDNPRSADIAEPAEPADVFSLAVEGLLDEARELEQDLLNDQGELPNWKCTTRLWSSNFSSLSSETTL